MPKIFNISGACRTDRYYMVKLDSRLYEMRAMIDNGDSFAINRARQYGKTTIFMMVINVDELIKNITDTTIKEYPQIPWKAIAGMRDIAAHKYQTLRMEDVYNTVCVDFPILEEQLNELIENSR